MDLYKMTSTHYGPKSSHTAIDCFLLASSREGALELVIKRAGLEESEKEQDAEGSVFDCAEGQADKSVAKALGLKPESYGYFTDLTWRQVFLLSGQDPCEVEDAFYGHTDYGFEKIVEGVTREQCEILSKAELLVTEAI